MDLNETLESLRRDTRDIEVKAAQGGFPENVATTMSAFSNTPGGGTIIFGVSEHQGFLPVGVYDSVKCQQAASNTARNALEPKIVITPELVSIDGKDVVVVFVPEADREAKPIRVIKTGQAFLRMYDGDYCLSDAEEQVLVAQRGHPRYDDQEITAAGVADLDQADVAAYIATRREASNRFIKMSDQEILVRTGVLSGSGEHPTLAGLLALGVYPQQFFPSLAIQASLVGSSGTNRALDSAYFTGPIPVMLQECMEWVHRVTPTAIMSDGRTGAVTDQPAYPPVALREMIGNALIHRDLSPASVNQPVIVRIEHDERMMIVSPGGLYGISVDGLGKAPSSLRNARLTEILMFVASGGQRVVERLSSGIPAAQQALADANMEPLEFDDRGVRFTVTMWARDDRGGWAGVSLAMEQVLKALEAGPATIAQLATKTGWSSGQVRYMTSKLVDSGHILREPLNGRTYLFKLSRRFSGA